MKNAHPTIDIDALREIGWSLWDPIGLNAMLDGWKGQSFEDEYDTYLVKAAGMLRNNCDDVEVVEYLFYIETEHMGLGSKGNEAKILARILKVVEAISGEPAIWTDCKATGK